MDIKIQTQTENKLLERKEINAMINFTGTTPSKKDIRTHLAGKIGANPDFVALRKVASEFGIKRIVVIAHVYKDAELLKKNEPYHILVRNGFAEKKEKKKKEKKTAAPKKK